VANKHGRVAGTNIGGGKAAFPGVLGSSCFKVFHLEVASTGLNASEARHAGFKPKETTIQGAALAHSYPDHGSLQLRLVADGDTGRLLGAQGVGTRGVVSRVNILAAALTSGATVEELAWLDLAYAPPFSGAWDPIHIAAQKLLG
jgi:NADPH-dependent 2,4-dienoyl-CoA reductase/sulfur reductase-like enzyme